MIRDVTLNYEFIVFPQTWLALLESPFYLMNEVIQ